MKTFIINLFLLPALIACLGLLLTGRVTAQTFTTLHSFASGVNDGASPYAGLILAGSTLYGTTVTGGSSDSGTVFAVNTNGTGFTTLHGFTNGSDGAYPYGGLILSGTTLYGTATWGGSSGEGTVFKIKTDGTGFTTLHSFTAIPGPLYTNSDGAQPYAELILSGNTLYGTTEFGGSSGEGTVFKVNTNGTSFTNLHSFTALSGIFQSNSDGAEPQTGLILSGNTLYGTAVVGGTSGNGTVFKLNTDGTGFTTLYGFSDSGVSDGVNPYATLILSGNTLYGTAAYGGSSGYGTVFAINTNGTGFTNLHSFTSGSDGVHPYAGLILSGNTLYGTASAGGSSGNGTVFAVNTDGTGFTNLHSFTALDTATFTTNSDGADPFVGLILSGNILYGTAAGGGSSGKGTVFSFSLPPPPQLTIIRYGTNVVLSWPTNAAGFTLQSTTNLVSPLVWITNSPAPTVVNGQNTVTNPISGTKKFYRLSQ